VKLLWESLVNTLTEVFENQLKNQFCHTCSPLNGKISSSVDTPFWPALWNIFRTAFVKAFENNTEDWISLPHSSTDLAENSRNPIRKKEQREKAKKNVLKEENTNVNKSKVKANGKKLEIFLQ
jgi:hypothetical protein